MPDVRDHTIVDRIRSKIEAMAAERPVALAFFVFLGAMFVVIPISLPFYINHPLSFWENILAEAHGTLFDLLIIGWFLLWLNKTGERRRQNNRYREEIDDYLGWASPEATHRIAGNIRRLNRGGVVERMRLTEAFLKGANLAGAQLRKADLWGADLERAILREALLQGASLAGADLRAADLERADLTEADLRGCSLQEADLERAHLERADLRGASLNGADLQYAGLAGSDLQRANFTGANLRGANLEGADLRGANLCDANLRGANLEGANLHDVELEGTDLLGANLVQAKLPPLSDLLTAFRGAKTLFGAEFHPDVEEELQRAFPRLFQMADSAWSGTQGDGSPRAR